MSGLQYISMHRQKVSVQLSGIVICLTLIFTAMSVSAKTASVNTIQMNNLWKTLSPLNSSVVEQYPHQNCFKKSAKEHDIPVQVLLALARGESNFDAKVRSKSNAYGVMQILWPSTARHLGINSLSDLLKPCINIDAGARYLKELLKRYKGNLHLAMAAYNYGPGRIKAYMASSGMPSGAIWYSQYIYDHYQSIADRHDKQKQKSKPEYSLQTPVVIKKVIKKTRQKANSWLYQPNNQVTLVQFNQPYRAKSFVEYLKNQSPSLKIDWFKTPQMLYHVVLRYENKKDFAISRQLLKKQGFII